MSLIAISLLHQLIFGHRSGHQQSGINIAVAIGVVSGIITISGAVYAAVAFPARRRRTRTDRRIHEIVETQLSAEDVEKNTLKARMQAKEVEDELGRLKGVRDDLSFQISQLPQQANKLFLARQLERLAESMRKDFREYQTVRLKLETVNGAGDLDPRIREFIEHDILPARRQDERRTSVVLVLLVVLIALSLSPIHVSDYIWNYFSILSGSPNWTIDAPAWMIATGGLAVTGLALITGWLGGSMVEARLATMGRYRFVVIFSVLLLLTTLLGYFWRNDALMAACTPIACAYPVGDYVAGGIAFNIAPIACGLLIVTSITLMRNRLRLRTRRVASRVGSFSAHLVSSRTGLVRKSGPGGP